MTEEMALRQAILAAPDDDLPRLVYADWWEEHRDAGRAAFIRAQVQLAQLPPWEPAAVRARHHQPHLLDGAPWRGTLPDLGPLSEWHEHHPFRRGFGWSVRIRQMGTFLVQAEELFAREPIGELVLPAATRDEWELLADAPWLTRIKNLRFTTGSTLSEPIRALAGSPFSTNIESIAFEVSTSPGMGAVVELLVQSKLARQLKELVFRIGHDRDGEILEELSRAADLRLEKLTLVTMGQTAEAMAHLANLPNADHLKCLNILHQPVGEAVAGGLRGALHRFPLQQFMVVAGQLTGSDVLQMMESQIDFAFRTLNLSQNVLGDGGLAALCAPGRFEKLRALDLSRCGLDAAGLAALTHSTLWPNLVELNLSGNRFGDAGARPLLDAPPPSDLVALLLPHTDVSDDLRSRLVAHFGDRVLF